MRNNAVKKLHTPLIDVRRGYDEGRATPNRPRSRGSFGK